MVFAQRTLHLLGMSKESALILEDRFEEALMLAPSMELPSRIFSGLNETAQIRQRLKALWQMCLKRMLTALS